MNPNDPFMIDNLCQVKTGEGKSVVLAMTSAVMALYGFNVSVACYSEYLSKRDMKDFESLYDILGVTKKIFYGTFN